MITFPYAKINLGLTIRSPRRDGYHDLESIFYPLPLRDILEIIPADTTTLTELGIPLAGNPSENLVLRAYKLLKQDFPDIPPVNIFLYKDIPSGAGLGGGSSDAAAMLRLMNELFTLELPPENLKSYALHLGSDCPFFLQPSPCFVSGRGDILEQISLDLSAYSVLLVHPELPISTAWAFTQVRPNPAEFNLKAIVSEPVKNWGGHLQNDFEPPVFRQFPVLAEIKNKLYAAGALYASMTGSGSSLFAIFNKNQQPALAIYPGTRQSWLP